MTSSKREPTETSLEGRVLVSLVDERAQRLATYFFVFGMMWGVSGTFILWKRGIEIAAYPYAVMAAIFLFALVEKKRWLNKNITINLFLITNYVGLLTSSSISQYRESTIEFHFALISLMAVQLLGMRSALRWFTLTILAIFVSLYLPLGSIAQLSLGNSLDHLFSAISLSVTILWICEYSEQCFLQRTTQLQELADRDHEKSRLLRLAEETASIGHWRWRLQDGATVFSDELKRICVLPELDHIDQLLDRFDSGGRDRLRNALDEAAGKESSFSMELSFTQDEEERHITCRGFSELGPDGTVEAVFGVIRDETKLWETTRRLSRKAEELNQLANVDTLTGLYNRLWFRNQLELMIDNAALHQEEVALLVLDMDGFKEINDTLGHASGDLVLIETANRIKNLVSDVDIVSRLGGDEFTIIIPNPKSVGEVKAIGQQIVDAIRKPMHFENTTMQVGASIGVSICPADTNFANELFTYADTAMYYAKFNNKDVSVYSASMTDELVQRKKLESQLSDAVDREEFSLLYQPQYQTRSGEIVGFEALIRWNRDGRIVSPVEFIPVLESSGQIIEIGQWILNQCCRQLKQWELQGYNTRVAVNISPVQFRDPTFYDSVVRIIESHDVDPSRIDLEITEGVIISDVNHTAETLKKLKAFGCMISIDDFGTGYSSLAYLKDFPIDQLKIDRAFVKDFPNHDDGTIASSIIVLGLSLGMEVLAEGVETEEQLEFLKMHDCEFFQGYLGSKPVSPEECSTMLAKQNSGVGTAEASTV